MMEFMPNFIRAQGFLCLPAYPPPPKKKKNNKCWLALALRNSQQKQHLPTLEMNVLALLLLQFKAS